MQSSNYLIFVDEAGDHLLTKYPPDFSVFVLAFVIVTKAEYCDRLLPEFAKLKLKYFPDVNIIFHEREIRKAQGKFEILTDTKTRTDFMCDLSSLMQEINYKIVAVAINKMEKARDNLLTENLYELGVECWRIWLAVCRPDSASNRDTHFKTKTTK
ncbi:MAG: hypothetical protein LBJ25_08095 [Candidatus Margulisbacteria bacterium]|jgi:hypothetical protein|nr:hypothetical protein [Candidatus Margulisiibacteriota bacterium]